MSTRRSMVLLAAATLWACAAAAGQDVATRPSRVTPVVEAYRRASPAVVNISTQRLVRTGPGMFGFGDDPFEDFMLNIFGRTVPAVSLGSGFVIHPDGYIITNAHVVRRAQKITATMSDGSSFPASVVASNDEHDLAVLKVEGAGDRKFAHLPLGRSDDLMIGETVIAIGNPLGYQNTCTTGVLSSIDRTLQFSGGETYKGLLQIDAPINPGNSGGPLLNIAGELIGINTAIRPDAQGIGFAIPVDALTKDLPALADFERLNRVVVGVKVRQERDAAGRANVEVGSVEAGSPADDAGCKAGDRLAAVNGRAIGQLSDYVVAMLTVKAGDKVHLRCLRSGRNVEVEVVVAARPKPEGAALARRHFGMVLVELTAETVQRLRLPNGGGLLVASVEPDSPAAQLGVRPDDIVIQLGRWYVSDLERLGAILEDVQPGQTMRIGIIRGNVRAWAAIQARRIDTSPSGEDKLRI